MKKLVVVALISLFVMACGKHATDTQTDCLYQTLDSLIDRHSELVAAKKSQIMSLSSGLQGVKLTPEQEYDMNLRLYDEYLAFRFDSAFYYINKNIQSPLATTDPERHAARDLYPPVPPHSCRPGRIRVYPLPRYFFPGS